MLPPKMGLGVLGSSVGGLHAFFSSAGFSAVFVASSARTTTMLRLLLGRANATLVGHAERVATELAREARWAAFMLAILLVGQQLDGQANGWERSF